MAERLTDDELLRLFETVRRAPRPPWKADSALPEALRAIYEVGLLGSGRGLAKAGELCRRLGHSSTKINLNRSATKASNAELAKPYIDRFAQLRRVSADALRDAKLRGAVSRERRFAFWVIRSLPAHPGSRRPRFSFPEIGEAFNVDHSSVVKAFQQAKREVRVNPALRSQLAAVLRSLAGDNG